MMRIINRFFIQCEKCNRMTTVEADELEYKTLVYDRPMGEEIEYVFFGEMCCEECYSRIDFSIRGYEYPVGAFCFSDCECHGGSFIEEPVPAMDYQFDIDYYDDAYEEYENANSILEHNREKIQNMSPREFEVFVAEIFEKIGFSVRVTKATRDGGVDIIATKKEPIPYTLLVECKHWGENHKVDVRVVRSVYGVQVAMQANKSVIVTSSKFTKDAREFATEQKEMVTLWDIDDLLNLTMSLDESGRNDKINK